MPVAAAAASAPTTASTDKNNAITANPAQPQLPGQDAGAAAAATAAAAAAAQVDYNSAAYQQYYYNYYYGGGAAAYGVQPNQQLQQAAYPFQHQSLMPHYPGYGQDYTAQYPSAPAAAVPGPHPPSYPPPQNSNPPSQNTPRPQWQQAAPGQPQASPRGPAHQQHQHQHQHPAGGPSGANSVPISPKPGATATGGWQGGGQANTSSNSTQHPYNSSSSGTTVSKPSSAPLTIKMNGWVKPQAKPNAAPAYTKAAATPAPPAHTQAQQSYPTKAAAAAASKAGPPASAKFPPSFTAWVERCFSRCRTDAERQTMTTKLSSKIKVVEAAGRMWLVDWDVEPVPSLAAEEAPAPRADASKQQPLPHQQHHQHQQHQQQSPHDGHVAGGRGKRGRWQSDGNDDGGGGGGEYQDKPVAMGRGRGRHQFQQRQQQMQQQRGNKKAKRGAAGFGAADAGDEAPPGSEREQDKRSQRAGRFGDGRAVGGVLNWEQRPRPSRRQHDSWYHNNSRDEEEEEEDAGWVEEYEDEELDLAGLSLRGTNTELEKSYFRLTAAPDASTVRPEPVLRRALERLVTLYRDGAVNYFYTCDQFKGLRQVGGGRAGGWAAPMGGCCGRGIWKLCLISCLISRNLII